MPLFGGPLRFILFTVLPAGFVGYFPAELIRQPTFTAVLAAVGGALGFSALAVFVFSKGLERYESGNRFGVRA
jgi:ABC-2 type transport system permease protein